MFCLFSLLLGPYFLVILLCTLRSIDTGNFVFDQVTGTWCLTKSVLSRLSNSIEHGPLWKWSNRWQVVMSPWVGDSRDHYTYRTGWHVTEKSTVKDGYTRGDSQYMYMYVNKGNHGTINGCRTLINHFLAQQQYTNELYYSQDLFTYFGILSREAIKKQIYTCTCISIILLNYFERNFSSL